MIFFSDNISPVALSVRDAVRLSGLSRSALYLRIAEGAIDARKAGRRTLILADSLLGYIKGLPPLSPAGTGATPIRRRR